MVTDIAIFWVRNTYSVYLVSGRDLTHEHAK